MSLPISAQRVSGHRRVLFSLKRSISRSSPQSPRPRVDGGWRVTVVVTIRCRNWPSVIRQRRADRPGFLGGCDLWESRDSCLHGRRIPQSCGTWWPRCGQRYQRHDAGQRRPIIRGPIRPVCGGRDRPTRTRDPWHSRPRQDPSASRAANTVQIPGYVLQRQEAGGRSSSGAGRSRPRWRTAARHCSQSPARNAAVFLAGPLVTGLRGDEGTTAPDGVAPAGAS